MNRIYKKKNASKRGFTLIEIVLGMAIMIIVIPLVFSAFYLVYRSHAGVTVINDAKDFASLHATAIENVLVNASAASVTNSADGSYSSSVYSSGGKVYLRRGGSAAQIFSYDQYQVGDGKDKWDVRLQFSLDANKKILTYSVMLYDNGKPSSTPYYTLTSSIYLPNGNRNDVEKLVAGSGGTCVNFRLPAV